MFDEKTVEAAKRLQEQWDQAVAKYDRDFTTKTTQHATRITSHRKRDTAHSHERPRTVSHPQPPGTILSSSRQCLKRHHGSWNLGYGLVTILS